MKTNRNEVEKGFLQRSFRQELVGIKENWQTQSSKGHIHTVWQISENEAG